MLLLHQTRQLEDMLNARCSRDLEVLKEKVMSALVGCIDTEFFTTEELHCIHDIVASQLIIKKMEKRTGKTHPVTTMLHHRLTDTTSSFQSASPVQTIN